MRVFFDAALIDAFAIYGTPDAIIELLFELSEFYRNKYSLIESGIAYLEQDDE